MTYQKEARTAFASRAMVVGEMFTMKFRHTKLGDQTARTVTVTPPDTESTGGGKMARETISLVPDNGAREGTVVCGWIDVGANTAELRSYAVLAHKHRQRFGSLPFDISRAAYDAFLDEVQDFLNGEGITPRVLDNVPEEEAKAAVEAAHATGSARTATQKIDRGSGGGLLWPMMIAVVVGLLVGGLAVFFVLK